MDTREHISQLGCTGFHRNSQDLNLIQKRVALPRETETERRQRRGGGSSPRGEEHWRGRRRIAAGEERSPVRGEIARDRESAGRGEEMSLWLGLGLEVFF
jgi:hypothetical protein